MASLQCRVVLRKCEEVQVEDGWNQEKKRGRQMENHIGALMRLEHLPHELVFEIMKRLPVKSLISLRCTCKFWYTKLTDPNFLHLHLKYALKNPTYLLVCKFSDDKEKHIYFAEKVGQNIEVTKCYEESKFAAATFSSGGLIAWRVVLSKCYDISNPITGEQVKVPFDPELGEALLSWGFGYSFSTKEYKIVTLGHQWVNSHITYVGAIYTLGSESWREIPHVPYGPFGEPVDCNGTLFWLAHRAYHRETVFSFDVGIEKFQAYKGPSVTEDRYLIKMGDTVAQVYKTWPNMQVWVLRDKVNDVWINEYNVCSKISIFLGEWTNCEIAGYCDTSRRFVSYCAKSGDCKTIKSNYEWFKWLQGYPQHASSFVGSLISPSKILAMAKHSS